MAAFTGWTLKDIYRDLTLPRYAKLVELWGRWPPVAVCVAAMAGIKQPSKVVTKDVQPFDDEQWRDLCALLNLDPEKAYKDGMTKQQKNKAKMPCPTTQTLSK